MLSDYLLLLLRSANNKIWTSLFKGSPYKKLTGFFDKNVERHLEVNYMGGIFKYVILSFGGILVAVSLMLIANLDQFASATIVSSEGSLTTDIGFDQTLDNDSSCAFWVYFGDTIALSGAEELADANYGGNGTAQITHSATLN